MKEEDEGKKWSHSFFSLALESA